MSRMCVQRCEDAMQNVELSVLNSKVIIRSDLTKNFQPLEYYPKAIKWALCELKASFGLSGLILHISLAITWSLCSHKDFIAWHITMHGLSIYKELKDYIHYVYLWCHGQLNKIYWSPLNPWQSILLLEINPYQHMLVLISISTSHW